MPHGEVATEESMESRDYDRDWGNRSDGDRGRTADERGSDDNHGHRRLPRVGALPRAVALLG